MALFARGALTTGFLAFARLALFTRLAFATLFAVAALFTWFALFIAAAVTAAILAAAVAALTALRLTRSRFGRSSSYRLFFLAGEQADQRFNQALEQARLGSRLRSQSGRSRRRGGSRSRLARRYGFYCGFLANQGAGGADRLGIFRFARSHFVARQAGHDFRAVIAQTLHFEVRRFEMVVRQNDDARAGAQLDLGDGVALLVEQEGGNRDRHLGANLGGTILQSFFFDQAQDGQRQGFDVADDALTVAARADDAAGLAEGRTQALTGHFQQTEARNAADLDAGAVGFQSFADFFFHGALVLGRSHIDEVDDDQAADITQAQLAGDFFGRFQVGLQGGFFDVAAFGRTRRVDVDGHQGFGRVDHDGATGRQLHFALEGGFDLAFDLEAVEQRHAVFVQLDLAGVLRHDLLDEGQGFFLGFDAVDQNFTDVLAQVVADGADDDVGFLINQERRAFLAGGVLDGAPQLQQVVEVPLQFFAGAAQARGAHDQAHVGRCVEAVQSLAQFVALLALDAAGDATGAGVVWHQHQIAAGQADEGGQGSAFVAALFLLDLNDDFLAFLQDFLDVDAAFGGLGEVFAGDFLERQEAVALGAEVDEGSLEAGFDASNAALVDVGLLLLTSTGFDIQVIELLAIYQSNTQLFGLSCVNQHSFHVVPFGLRAIRKRRSAHTTLLVGVQVRCRGGGPSLCPANAACGHIATASPACCNDRKQSIRRRNQSGAADKLAHHLDAGSLAAGRLCVSTLHINPENRVPLTESGSGFHIGQIINAICSFSFPVLGLRMVHVVGAFIRRTVWRPLIGSQAAHMGLFPLWHGQAALDGFATIAATIKCFNCIKIVIIRA